MVLQGLKDKRESEYVDMSCSVSCHEVFVRVEMGCLDYEVQLVTEETLAHPVAQELMAEMEKMVLRFVSDDVFTLIR